jgi:hypothetical protein
MAPGPVGARFIVPDQPPTILTPMVAAPAIGLAGVGGGKEGVGVTFGRSGEPLDLRLQLGDAVSSCSMILSCATLLHLLVC